MVEPAPKRLAGGTRFSVRDRLILAGLVVLGCFLVLQGNALPWPCLPWSQSWPDCYPVIVYDLSLSLAATSLVIGLLVFVLATTLMPAPLDLVSWLLILLVPYLLFVARLRLDPLFGKAYWPLANVNRNLTGPSFFVMPVSWIVAWLALRPRSLQKKARPAAIALALVLLVLTGYFLVVMGRQPFRITLSSFVRQAGVLRTGPLLILTGGVLLLGAEFASGKRPDKQAAPSKAPVATSLVRRSRARRVGFWSAVIAAASPLALLLISQVGGYRPAMQGLEVGVYALTGVLRVGAGLLSPVALVVLMASILYCAPSEKKAWGRGGLAFAALHLTAYAASAFVYSFTARVFPQLSKRLATGLPVLRRYGATGVLRFVLASLSLLLVLPLFRREGLERVIRWCSMAIGVLALINVLGYLLTNDRIPMPYALLYSIARWIVFPVYMVCVAVVFRREEGTEVTGEIETS